MNKKMIIYIVQQKINFKIINSFIQNNISIYNKIIKNKTQQINCIRNRKYKIMIKLVFINKLFQMINK